MADVEFEDYSIKVKAAIDDKINAALEECAGALESAAKRNTRVKSGQLKSSWRHHVDTSAHIATIGNPLENAIWEEFGTGEYALAGNGRKGGWSYKDEQGEWHYTTGKKPSRAFHNAYTATKQNILNRLQNALKGL